MLMLLGDFNINNGSETTKNLITDLWKDQVLYSKSDLNFKVLPYTQRLFLSWDMGRETAVTNVLLQFQR